MTPERQNIFQKLWMPLAIIALGLGITLLTFLVVQYFVGFRPDVFQEHSSAANLATIVAGSVGILFSLASTMFFVHNLQLQRLAIEKQTDAIRQTETQIGQQNESLKIQKKDLDLQLEEMRILNKTSKKQLKTLSAQQAEGTFFHLLENHRSLVDRLGFENEPKLGYEALEDMLAKYSAELNNYGFSLEACEFKGTRSTVFSSLEIIFSKQNGLEALCLSINHIQKLIRVKLGNDSFYHETLYNYLSNGEKYFLGLCYENEVLLPKELPNFDYSKFFKDVSCYHSKKEHGYFPAIKLSHDGTSFNAEKRVEASDLINFLRECLNTKFEVQANYLEGPALRINSISSTMLSHREIHEHDGKKINLNFEVTQSAQVQFFDSIGELVKDVFYTFCNNRNNNLNKFLILNYHCSFDNKEICLTAKLELEFGKFPVAEHHNFRIGFRNFFV